MTEIILGFISTHEYKEKDVWETVKERTGLGDTELWVNWKGQLEDDSFWSWNPRLMLVLLMKWGKLGSWCFFGGGGREGMRGEVCIAQHLSAWWGLQKPCGAWGELGHVTECQLLWVAAWGPHHHHTGAARNAASQAPPPKSECAFEQGPGGFHA